MRVDSSESEVRQDGMLPADEKSMLFAFVFPEVQTNAKENKPKDLRCIIASAAALKRPKILSL